MWYLRGICHVLHFLCYHWGSLGKASLSIQLSVRLWLQTVCIFRWLLVFTLFSFMMDFLCESGDIFSDYSVKYVRSNLKLLWKQKTESVCLSLIFMLFFCLTCVEMEIGKYSWLPVLPYVYNPFSSLLNVASCVLRDNFEGESPALRVIFGDAVLSHCPLRMSSLVSVSRVELHCISTSLLRDNDPKSYFFGLKRYVPLIC